MFIKILILSLLLYASFGEMGLQKAGALIKEPLNSHRQTNDVALSGIADKVRSSRLQVTSTSHKSRSWMGNGDYGLWFL